MHYCCNGRHAGKQLSNLLVLMPGKKNLIHRRTVNPFVWPHTYGQAWSFSHGEPSKEMHLRLRKISRSICSRLYREGKAVNMKRRPLFALGDQSDFPCINLVWFHSRFSRQLLHLRCSWLTHVTPWKYRDIRRKKYCTCARIDLELENKTDEVNFCSRSAEVLDRSLITQESILGQTNENEMAFRFCWEIYSYLIFHSCYCFQKRPRADHSEQAARRRR